MTDIGDIQQNDRPLIKENKFLISGLWVFGISGVFKIKHEEVFSYEIIEDMSEKKVDSALSASSG